MSVVRYGPKILLLIRPWICNTGSKLKRTKKRFDVSYPEESWSVTSGQNGLLHLHRQVHHCDHVHLKSILSENVDWKTVLALPSDKKEKKTGNELETNWCKQKNNKFRKFTTGTIFWEKTSISKSQFFIEWKQTEDTKC